MGRGFSPDPHELPVHDDGKARKEQSSLTRFNTRIDYGNTSGNTRATYHRGRAV